MSSPDAHTVAELLRLRTREIPDASYLTYPDSNGIFQQYSFRDVDRLSSHLVSLYSKTLPLRASSADAPKVLAILGASSFDYLINVFALQKLGFTVLLLSTRIADPAYRHLFEKTGCRDVLIQPSFRATMERVASSFGESINVQQMIPAAYPRDVTEESLEIARRYESRIDPKSESSTPAWIIHSSGSTGLPKPVGQTQESIMNSAFALRALVGKWDAYITLPFFHTFGTFSIIAAMASGRNITVHNADVAVTEQSMLEVFRSIKQPGVFYAVPYALKLISEHEEGIDYLSKTHLTIFGGSSAPEDLGNKLVERGVPLVSMYGSTEGGVLMGSNRDMAKDKEWSWLKLNPFFTPYAEWVKQPGASHLCELVVLPGWPSKVFSNRDDGAYATRDLFEQHPTNPEKWRYVGRLDDTIVLVNGEKANPVPLELAIRPSPLVNEVIVAGAERANLSAVVIARKDLPREDFIEQVWPYVQEGNKQVPAYAQISKEAILILPAGTDYPQTDKGTPIRQAFLRKFSKEIDQFYDELDSVANDPNSGLELSRDETRAFVREAVENVLGLETEADRAALGDHTDMFSFGLDSLQAMRLWRKITRELNTGGKKVGQNIAFEKPSIAALSNYLYGLRTGEAEEVETAEQKTQRLIEKYSEFPQHVPGEVKVDGEYIVLTGATGSLGAHLAAQLAARDHVRKIYCLNRASSNDKAQERTISSLKERLVYDRLSPQQLAKIVSFSSDLSREDLGLSSTDFQEVRKTTTSVIHCAWAVNFNMDVTSFESHHINGAYNLIKLCLSSPQNTPASFNFCSSVSAVAASKNSPVPEELPQSFASAIPMGYAHSKLVTEHICVAAAAKTGIAARIHRIGQVVGDTVNGHWNATEAIPLTVQSARTIGKLPVVPGDEQVSWLPVDVVAATVIECSQIDPLPAGQEPPAKDAVFAIMHPKLLSWNNQFLPALKEAGLEFEAVDQREWVKALEASPQDAEKNPPTKLMEFFKGRYGGDKGEQMPRFVTARAERYSQALRECKVPDAGLFKKFLKYWQESAW